MQIQAEEKPTFDKIFISHRIFSSRNVFFSVLGKIIEESSGNHILDECKILAKGSINSYKRRKRMLALLDLAFEILHF